MAREKREKVVVVRLSEKEHADLLALAELTGRTGSDAIRRAIRNELMRERATPWYGTVTSTLGPVTYGG